MQCIMGNTVFLSYTAPIDLEEDHPIVSPQLLQYTIRRNRLKIHLSTHCTWKTNFFNDFLSCLRHLRRILHHVEGVSQPHLSPRPLSQTARFKLKTHMGLSHHFWKIPLPYVFALGRIRSFSSHLYLCAHSHVGYMPCGHLWTEGCARAGLFQ